MWSNRCKRLDICGHIMLWIKTELSGNKTWTMKFKEVTFSILVSGATVYYVCYRKWSVTSLLHRSSVSESELVVWRLHTFQEPSLIPPLHDDIKCKYYPTHFCLPWNPSHISNSCGHTSVQLYVKLLSLISEILWNGDVWDRGRWRKYLSLTDRK
jgi:hypothetical protein